MKTQEDIKNEIRDSLTSILGQPIKSVTLDDLKTGMEKTLTSLAKEGVIATPIEPTPSVVVEFLWKKMSLKEKIKWFAFNRFPFAKEGEAHRQALYALRAAKAEVTKDLENMESVELPNYLEPNPKALLVMDYRFMPIMPLEYITMNFTIEDENGKI